MDPDTEVIAAEIAKWPIVGINASEARNTTEPARVLAFFLTDPNDPMLRMDSAQDEAAG
jgi:hypothetical protein